MSHRLAGVDVGGTFTDLLYLDESSGEVRLAKVPTTTGNQAFGVLEALDRAGVDLAALDLLVHGTTTTTNALLERKLAATGLITTRGFRDVLELGRRTRPKPYGLTGWFEPLIPRELRLEVAERMGAEGRVVVPLDEEAVARTAHELLARGCESVVIHFLHAYRNPEHERRAKRIVAALWPTNTSPPATRSSPSTASTNAAPAAAVNACVQPILARYLSRLVEELAARSYRRDVLVMRGNGGTVSARAAADSAVNTIMSGPASGVIAAARTAAEAGFENVITCDMGGTSCDVGLIRDGVPAVSSELEVEYAVPIHVPMVDVHSIGAGGGSIAFVNEAGLVQVGPESAGASPGPICFGRGGERVTITGRQPAPRPAQPPHAAVGGAAGSARRDRNAVRGADRRGARDRRGGGRGGGAAHRQRPHGGGVAHGVARTRTRSARLRAVRVRWRRPAARRGVGAGAGDPQGDRPCPSRNHERARVHGRGSAPRLRAHGQHAAGRPGRRDRPRDPRRADPAWKREMLARERVPFDSVRVIHAADMQFQGQSHLLGVPLTTATPALDELQALFERAYWKRFEVELPEIRAVLVNLHTAVLGRRPGIALAALAGGRDARDEAGQPANGAHALPPEGHGAGREAVERRDVLFPDGRRETPILRRESLDPGHALEGPAIIEQLDTTTVLPPGFRATVDDAGNLIIHVPAS